MSSRNHGYMVVAWRALALLFDLAPYSILGQSDVGTLRGTIRDKASGAVVPAMICITSLADHTWRVPPDGRDPAPFLRNIDFIAARWKSSSMLRATSRNGSWETLALRW